ncbi:Protein kinase domain [Rhizoctonia solani]|uniref:Protein kinase domain n=1 Tax=Rhizoctonia solani TaxID=456999 RepID=A0A8H7H506_9AGAM|nr:Protein kinase domain [Rhizoctonia solani]
MGARSPGYLPSTVFQVLYGPYPRSLLDLWFARIRREKLYLAMNSTNYISYMHTDVTASSPEELSEIEKRWVTFQPYLLSKGYQLRPRYRPGWKPSWEGTNLDPISCEDSGNAVPVRTLDATRLSDQLQVIIKMVIPSDDDREGEEELDIVQHLSSNPYSTDPRNHTVECLDSFAVPGLDRAVFYVMPLLREYNDPPFHNLYEIRNFLVQIFEGLRFLHVNDIAHCDIASANIMMNGQTLYDEPFHPFYQDFSLDRKRQIRARYLRSQRPVRYYFIDFGYAKWFRDPAQPRVVHGYRARERTPEQLRGNAYDPFKSDIYQLGALIRRDLIPEYPALRFLLPLAREMTDYNPAKRPKLEQAYKALVTQFDDCPGWAVRWPIVTRGASLRERYVAFVAGATAELFFLLEQFVALFFPRVA